MYSRHEQSSFTDGLWSPSLVPIQVFLNLVNLTTADRDTDQMYCVFRFMITFALFFMMGYPTGGDHS
jgi:hypothetical protein